MRFHARLKNLPQVPQHFLDRAIEIAQFKNANEYTLTAKHEGYFERNIVNGDQIYQTSRTRRYDIGEDFVQWTRQNIISEFRQASVSVLEHRGPSLGPHSDVTTFFRLIYPIITGGPDCRTVWWQEKHQGIFPFSGHEVSNYEHLTEIEQAKLEPYCWYIIDTRPLHSVESVIHNRVALHVSLFSCESFKLVCPEIAHWNDHV